MIGIIDNRDDKEKLIKNYLLFLSSRLQMLSEADLVELCPVLETYIAKILTKPSLP